MPHIKPSQFKIEIVGENNYQKNIRESILYDDLVDRNDMDFSWETLTAQLVLEDENKFDPDNAVRVDMGGNPVGYLTKEDAKYYRKKTADLNLTEPCTCRAAVYGQRDAPGRMMKFGVWLFIDLHRNIEFEEPKKRKKLFGIF